jgi:hypothetical protein
MHAAVVELVQAADVIEVPVRRDRDHRRAHRDGVHHREQRPHAVREVHDQIGVATRQMPHVGLQQVVDVGFPEAGDAVPGVLRREPGVRDRQAVVAHARSAIATTPAGGRRQCSEVMAAL